MTSDRTSSVPRRLTWRPAVAWLAALAIAACGRPPGPGELTRGAAPPGADSATTLLWHLDETAGSRVEDAGLLRLDGYAGRDANTDFGRFGSARVFTRSVQSFLYRPYEPALDSLAALTVEAWVYLARLDPQEGGPVVARWTQQAHERSWLLTVTGLKYSGIPQVTPSPGYLADLVAFAPSGHVVFVIQPEEASDPLSYASTQRVRLEQWTHIAATFDGETVRIYLDGLLDAQFEHRGRIRRSPAPVVVGNYLDPRLIDIQSDIAQMMGGEAVPYYAFEGMIDELRISRVARDDFRYVRGR